LRALVLVAIATITVVPSYGNQGAATGASAAGEANLRVTLLGTGTPGPSITRFGPSLLVEAGTETLLFDAGRGATIRLTQAGVPLRRIAATFLTHLHSDHDVDHGEHIKPALGYRIDYRGHAVLLSGETRYSQNLIKDASGVDVLVHEVMLATTEQLAAHSVAAGMAHHTSPEQAGECSPR